MSSFFYFYLKKEIPFGFLGGFVFSLLGSILGVYLLGEVLKHTIIFLMNKIGNVNIIAGLIGAYIFMYIYNKINHDKQKKVY